MRASEQSDRHANWHWQFHSQPEPLPERIVGADPDGSYENCLAGSGAARRKSLLAGDGTVRSDRADFQTLRHPRRVATALREPGG
ncbi:hypothetical protein SPHV1_1000011 [Novosphingobium sp. KN65.2]|nr:hypothetical protein SPHV1_1000011 [Novosphingobium sp. KN65.2]